MDKTFSTQTLDLPEENNLHIIPLANNYSILVYVDTTTFATKTRNPKTLSNVTNSESTKYQPKKCVMGCEYTTTTFFHRVPQDEESLEIWRKKLKLEHLRKSHRICNKHFNKRLQIAQKRLPNWVVPDSPEVSDSEDNNTTEKKDNDTSNICNLWKITRIPEENTKIRIKNSLYPANMKKDILACK
ncbi:uncharacterized protein LOC129917936 isoform X2 [Episyrphus balteatus]|uniref:uncharacterized protein LOC129917936 isoform X2 n=1 Tax=Episyrphus balteatus TaxID=286459 RepID=UPI0024866510|nr:uncharacterized protein LOC129917936 isoform X2 [Episyrphus balteatus]